MSPPRKAGRFAALGLATALVFSLGATTVSAHNHHPHKFHHHRHFRKVHVVPFTPFVARVTKPVLVPVVYYDCFGRPYYVWTTSYRTVPFGF